MASFVCKFNIKWKHVVIGFYFEFNQNTNLLNNFISFIALKIYKYKMFCRIENTQETEASLINNVKKCTIFWYRTIKYSKHKLTTSLIEKFINLL